MNSGGPGLALTRKARSDPKVHEPGLTRRGINQKINWFDVLVDQPLVVRPAEGGCDTDGKPQVGHRGRGAVSVRSSSSSVRPSESFKPGGILLRAKPSTGFRNKRLTANVVTDLG